MLTLRAALRQAGLVPIETELRLENYSIDVLQRDSKGLVSISEPLNQKFLRPWENQSAGTNPLQSITDAKLTLIFFWMPGCENCIESMKELRLVSLSPRFPTNLQVSFMAYGIDYTQSVADDMETAQLPGPVFLDSSGGISERLAILGSPALVLLDEIGTVVAHMNGEINFDSPGFDLLLSKIKMYGAAPQTYYNGTSRTFSTSMKAETEQATAPRVTFLGVPFFGFFFIGGFLVICYCLVKSQMRHRMLLQRRQK